MRCGFCAHPCPRKPESPSARNKKARSGAAGFVQWRTEANYFANAFNRVLITLMSTSAPVTVARAFASRTSAWRSSFFSFARSSGGSFARGRRLAEISAVPLFMMYDRRCRRLMVAVRVRIPAWAECGESTETSANGSSVHLPNIREAPVGKRGAADEPLPRCAQLFANSLASVQSALFSFWPSPIPATPRVRLRRMPMPSV